MNGKMLICFVGALLMTGTWAGNVRGEEEKSKPDERLLFSFTLGNQDGYVLEDQSSCRWRGKNAPYPDGKPEAKRVPGFGAKVLEWADPFYPGIEFTTEKDLASLGYFDGFAVEAWVLLRRYLDDYGEQQPVGRGKFSDIISAGTPFYFRIYPSCNLNCYFRLTPADPKTEPWGTTSSGESLGNKAVPLNKWTHVAYSYDAKSGYVWFFLNGRQVNENDLRSNKPTSFLAHGDYFKDFRVNLGAEGQNGPIRKIKIGANIIGSIDGVKVWLYPKRDFIEEVKRCEKYFGTAE